MNLLILLGFNLLRKDPELLILDKKKGIINVNKNNRKVIVENYSLSKVNNLMLVNDKKIKRIIIINNEIFIWVIDNFYVVNKLENQVIKTKQIFYKKFERSNDNKGVLVMESLKLKIYSDNKYIYITDDFKNYIKSEITLNKNGIIKTINGLELNLNSFIYNGFDMLRPYPYYNENMEKEKLKDIIKLIDENNVKELISNERVTGLNSNVSFSKLYNNKSFVYNISNYLSTKLLTDYFVEDIRIRCKNRGKKTTELEAYNEMYNDELTKEEFRKITKRRSCSLFPINFVYNIYKEEKVKNILDMCAGWGDRLIAALLYKCDNYYGVDPNIYLEDRYKEMIDFYKMNNGTYKVIPKRFEDTTMKDFDNKKFDIMLTSPPYYDAECYSEDFPYKDLNDWLNNFIYKSLSKVVELLNKNGKIYLLLSDVKIFISLDCKLKIEYMENILNYLNNIEGVKYLGMKKFKFEDYNKKYVVQPIWIFQKVK